MKIILSVVLLATCANAFLIPSVKTVDALDIFKYVGRWYEMYNSLVSKSTFQRDSYCTTATYILQADKILIYNAARKKFPTGNEYNVTGSANTGKNNRPGEFIINFGSGLGVPNASTPNYLVVKLGPPTFGIANKYQYTVITSVGKSVLWILARDPVEFKAKYEKEVLSYVKKNGYNQFFNKPIATYHGPDCVYPKCDL